MRRPTLAARAAAIACMAVVALVIPSGALAAPTGSQITSPSDPAFVTADIDTLGSLHIAGTTTGGSGDVDIRCYRGSSSNLVAGAVPVAGGAFSVDVSLTLAFYNSLFYPRPYCVLRAVPMGTTPAAAPDQASPFEGPHVGWGKKRTYTLGAAGAPNPADMPVDYAVERAQSRGYSDYDSAGSCGLCDTYLFDPATLQSSRPIWWGNAALYRGIDGDPATRSTVQVDGVDVYNPTTALVSPELKNNAGFPPLAYTTSVDAATGNLTIDETDPFVACDPQPAVYPPTDPTCPSFASPLVILHRTIVQDHDGRQVTITDRWQSNDQQPHQLDAIYDDTNENQNGAMAGHHSLYDFAWTGAGFTTYGDDTQITPPPSAPSTMFVKTDATTPDAGDSSNPIGALTYATVPSQIKMQHSADANQIWGDWQARYLRTIPASGELTITQVYSHDFSLASVQALAGAAEQALGKQPPASGGTQDSTPATTAETTSTTPTGSTSTPPAALAPSKVVKCKVPKLRGRSLRSAKRLLANAHCRLGKVTRKTTSRVRPGRVVGSKPKAGSVRTTGTRIAIALARRP